MESRTEVRVFKIDKSCDKCNQGMMIFNGSTFTTFHTVYDHRCNQCGHLETYKKKYPVIEYERI